MMESSSHPMIGLGNINITNGLSVCVYTANRPPIEPYTQQTDLMPIVSDEIYNIAQLTGNHWRKVFNVYAKLMFTFFELLNKRSVMLEASHPFTRALECPSWQAYRDTQLLQANSQSTLLFSLPDIQAINTVHIVMGKGYAEQLGYPCVEPYTVDHQHQDFAVYAHQNLIVCPYFDYRQLSNIKIEALVELMLAMIVKNKIGEH